MTEIEKIVDETIKTESPGLHKIMNATMDFEKTVTVISDYMKDDGHFGIIGIVDKPKGHKQESDCQAFDHEYVDQKFGYSGDDCFGYMYFPLKSGRYVMVEFQQ